MCIVYKHCEMAQKTKCKSPSILSSNIHQTSTVQCPLKCFSNFIAKYMTEAAYPKLQKITQLSLWLKAMKIGKLP